MKTILISTLAVMSLAGAVQAAPAVSDMQVLQAARCRGLAASEGLGKLDTTAIDAFLKVQGSSRELAVRSSAANKIASATAQGDKASGAKKEKLLAERNSVCAAWLQGGQ
jgi:hypothetical protein